MSKIDSELNFCVPRFDHFFSSDVNIVCTCSGKYKICFSKTSAITVYQVWGKDEGRRVIFEISPEEWVKLFQKNPFL